VLFDLRGHRRRAVQTTYVILAVLMGGGLVLFGIGGSSGGILDAVTGNNSGGANVNDQLQKRIDRQEERLKTSPANTAVLAELVRLNYQAAVSQQPSGSSTFPDDAKDELRAAGAYWDRYVKAKQGDPSPDLARFAYTIFGTSGLNQPAKAEEAVRAIAAQSNDSQTYLLLVQTATAAGDTRTAQLAAQKAVDLAPKGQRKQVQKLAEQVQKQSAATQPGAQTGP
jgi:hypothetical protein